MTKFKECLIAFVVTFGLVVGFGYASPAQAEPAVIDDGSGPRTAGAEIKEPGTGGPDHETPIDIPSVTTVVPKHPGKPPADDAPEKEIKEYKKELKAHLAAKAEREAQERAKERAEGLERARQIAKDQKNETRGGGPAYCTDHVDPDHCPKG